MKATFCGMRKWKGIDTTDKANNKHGHNADDGKCHMMGGKRGSVNDMARIINCGSYQLNIHGCI